MHKYFPISKWLHTKRNGFLILLSLFGSPEMWNLNIFIKPVDRFENPGPPVTWTHHSMNDTQ